MQNSKARALERLSTGIRGCDALCGGGLPRGRAVLLEPRAALRAGLLATPTLIVERRGRSLRLIGDLSRSEQLLDFLRSFSTQDA